MLFLKHPLRTKLDLLKPDYGEARLYRKIIMTPAPRIDISLLDKRLWQGISCKVQLGYQGL